MHSELNGDEWTAEGEVNVADSCVLVGHRACGYRRFPQRVLQMAER